MNIREIMTEDVEVVDPRTPIQKAAQRMRYLDIGSLPVCRGSRLIGMLTDRDLTIRALAEGKDPQETVVSAVMTPEVAYCFVDQEPEDAERIMEKNQIRRLPVLDRSRRLVGIVSLGDFAVQDDEHRAGETLEKVSQPSL